MSNLLLCYWLRGKSLHTCDTIYVSPETIVAQLKAHILECNGLLPATSIDIYKVPDDHGVPDDDSMEACLGSFSIAMLGAPLRATRKLSSYFKPPIPEMQLHLVVDRIPLVHCWCRGSNPPDFFTVEVPTVDDLGLLKRAVMAQGSQALANADISAVKLYKVSPSHTEDEFIEVLGANEADEELAEARFWKKVFSDVPFCKPPRIVVEWVAAKTAKLPPSVNRPITDISLARNQFLDANPKDKPSSCGTPSTFRMRQGGHRFIPCGRPRDDESVGKFTDDCESIKPTMEDNRLALELAIAMSRLYPNEAERVNHVKEVLAKYQIHLNSSHISRTGYWMDGDMSVLGHHYVIAEFKNEAAGGSAEAYFEAIAYYLETTKESATKYLGSPLPCLLLIIFGPHILFAGATWNLRPVVQVLSTPLACHYHSTDRRNLRALARLMAAFRNAIVTLETYYRNLQPLPIANSPSTQLFPHPTTYKPLPNDDAEDGKKQTINFQYEKGVAEHKLIFFATDEDGKRICVKFAHTYSAEAHRCLAAFGCAPVLRGLEEIAGDWLMAVFDALIDFVTLDSVPMGSLPSSVFGDMSNKLADFHKVGYVHGDIRDMNIMVSTEDPTKFMFVDFDWSGKVGEARYPPLVNTDTITRPIGARDGELIKAEHDSFMLARIRAKYTSN